MKRRFLATVMLMLYASLHIYGFLPYVFFKLNQDYIAQNHCVMRDVPGSDCKGNCQLKRMLDEQDTHQQDNPLPTVQLEQLPLHTLEAKTPLPVLDCEMRPLVPVALYAMRLLPAPAPEIPVPPPQVS